MTTPNPPAGVATPGDPAETQHIFSVLANVGITRVPDAALPEMPGVKRIETDAQRRWRETREARR